MTQEKTGTRGVETAGAGCGLTNGGAQSECSTLPEEKSVAAHSCFEKSP